MPKSSPTRGMWIEIDPRDHEGGNNRSSPTRGMWIEIGGGGGTMTADRGHPPHGGCGLKFPPPPPAGGNGLVIPHTGDVD